ncbi:hypothetical protein E2C01_091335 [Portunus trituberculatus]|uniref:Uncharacterized protein n=1 Tax=Portunus trituberculatus TaxID=210409 RepID=A0A5B7JSH2_PORTR|nr:hypothetical protein [Portunus trituberculatus]
MDVSDNTDAMTSIHFLLFLEGDSEALAQMPQDTIVRDLRSKAQRQEKWIYWRRIAQHVGRSSSREASRHA